MCFFFSRFLAFSFLVFFSHAEPLTADYYIAKRIAFRSLYELVSHYKVSSDGLCVALRDPCRKQDVPETADLSHTTKDQWEISRETIRLLRKLGSGQFGDVWEGVWNGTTSVAVKTLKAGAMDPADFLKEAGVMKKLRHPKLIQVWRRTRSLVCVCCLRDLSSFLSVLACAYIQLFAVCTDQMPFYIITELMKNGSLLDYLHDKVLYRLFSRTYDFPASSAHLL